MQRLRNRTLALAVIAAVATAGAAIAQSSPTPAQQKELDAARAELDGAASRYAALARKYQTGQPEPALFRRQLMRKPVLGVVLSPDESAGVRVAGVTPGSGAQVGGLKSGDRLIRIADEDIAGADGDARLLRARELLRDLDAGKPVRVAYLRDGRQNSVSLTPKPDQSLFVWNGPHLSRLDGHIATAGGNADGLGNVRPIEFSADSVTMFDELPLIAPEIDSEIVRVSRDGQCKGQACRLPLLSEAFRWSGLNLASVDPQLGHYFGTEQGVLVLSAGQELTGLQAGDVIQKIDGKPVDTPREAMAALRAKPADSDARVDYLRDRKPATAQVRIPKVPPLPPVPPPPPPPPPAPPAPPLPDGAAAAPIAPVAPAAPRVIERRRIVTVDKDGNRREWEDGDEAPVPANGQRIEQRRMVFVDDNGKTTVLEGDDAPPPPEPPAAPEPPTAGAPVPPPPPPPPPTPPLPETDG